jgi:hypothetical protein
VLDANSEVGNAFGSVNVTQGMVAPLETITFGAAVINNNTGLTAGASYTVLGDDVSASPVISCLTQARPGQDSPVEFTIDGSTNRRYAIVMVQLGTQAGGGGGGSGGGGGGGGGGAPNPGAPPIIDSVVITPPGTIPDGDTATITVHAHIPTVSVAAAGHTAAATHTAAAVHRAAAVDDLQYSLTVDKGVIVQTATKNVWTWTNA